MNNVADAIVIGGGIRGVCIAYYLARAGVRVTLLEKNALASGASGANFGFISMARKEPAHYTVLSLESGRLYEEIFADLDGPIDLRRKGTLSPICSEMELEEAREFVEQQRGVPGADIRLLDVAETRALEPALSEVVVGSIYYPQDMDVNPLLLTWRVARAAARHGAKILMGTEVIDIRVKSGRVTGIVTNKGYFEAPIVVNAAGIDVPRIGDMVGLSIPIIACRGQVITTDSLPPLLGRPVGEFKQLLTGHFFLGATNQFMGRQIRATLPEIRPILRKAIEVLPALRNATITRIWTGLRPWPPDGEPIMGGVPGIQGYYIAAGHSGITLGAVTGRLMADLITTGTTHLPIYHYSLARFRRNRLLYLQKVFEDYWNAGERVQSQVMEELAAVRKGSQ